MANRAVELQVGAGCDLAIAGATALDFTGAGTASDMVAQIRLKLNAALSAKQTLLYQQNSFELSIFPTGDNVGIRYNVWTATGEPTANNIIGGYIEVSGELIEDDAWHIITCSHTCQWGSGFDITFDGGQPNGAPTSETASPSTTLYKSGLAPIHIGHNSGGDDFEGCLDSLVLANVYEIGLWGNQGVEPQGTDHTNQLVCVNFNRREDGVFKNESTENHVTWTVDPILVPGDDNLVTVYDAQVDNVLFPMDLRRCDYTSLRGASRMVISSDGRSAFFSGEDIGLDTLILGRDLTRDFGAGWDVSSGDFELRFEWQTNEVWPNDYEADLIAIGNDLVSSEAIIDGSLTTKDLFGVKIRSDGSGQGDAVLFDIKNATKYTSSSSGVDSLDASTRYYFDLRYDASTRGLTLDCYTVGHFNTFQWRVNHTLQSGHEMSHVLAKSGFYDVGEGPVALEHTLYNVYTSFNHGQFSQVTTGEYTTHTETRTAGPRLIVPLYIYPPTSWSSFYSQYNENSEISIVINQGGGAPDANYQAACALAVAAGCKILGYVATNYGATAVATVEAAIDTFANDWSDYVSGIVFDEVPWAGTQVDYYSWLYQYVKGKTTLETVVFNPGTTFHPEYIRWCDVGIIFENTYAEWTVHTSRDYSDITSDSFRFGAIVHSTSTEANMNTAIDEAQVNGYDYLYVTNDVMPNPWDTVPTFWDEEVLYIRGINDPDAPTVSSATVSASGVVLTVVMSETITGTPSGFSLTAAGSAVALSSGAIDDDEITYTIEQIYSGQTVLLTYAGSDIVDASSNALSPFSNSAVTNGSTVAASSGEEDTEKERSRRNRANRGPRRLQKRRYARFIRRGSKK